MSILISDLQAGCKYCCSCKAGAWKMNPCAHITAMLMYLLFITANCLNSFLAKHNAHYPGPMNGYRHELWNTNQRNNDNTFPDVNASEILSVIDAESDDENAGHASDRKHNRHAVSEQHSDDEEDWGSDADGSNLSSSHDDDMCRWQWMWFSSNVIMNDDFDEITPLMFCHQQQHNVSDYNDNAKEMNVDANLNRSL